jgi:hypothetical protein
MQPSRVKALHIGTAPASEAVARIDQAQLLARFAICRAAGTAVRFAFGQDHDGSFIVDAAQQIPGDGLDQLPFDAPVASAQSLENPHHVLRR